MRIAVDATCWHNNRGYGRHARALLRALVRRDTGNQYTFVLDSADVREPLPSGSETRLIRAHTPAAQAASANGRRSLADMWRMSRALSSAEFGLLLFPTVYSFVPVFTRAKKLVMIHDVIAETYPKLTLPRASARWFWRAKVGLGRCQADAIVTVSEYSRAGIAKCFGYDPAKIFVAGEAADPVFRVLENPQPGPRLQAMGIQKNRPMIIYVGGFAPHKNLEALVGAFARFSAPFQDALLVMVGEYEKEVFHSYFGTIAAEVERRGLQDRVVFTGYLTDEDLATVLNLATVAVLPSLMEGFGLPAVEAAACGCPVIATNASPLPQLLGDGAIYIDPVQPALEAALARVLESEDLRQRMSAAGIAAAARLTWDAAAAQMAGIIREVEGA